MITVRFSDSHSKNDPNNKKKAQAQQTEQKKQKETKTPEPQTLTYPDPKNATTFRNMVQPTFVQRQPELTEKEKELMALLEAERKKNQNLLDKLSLCDYCLSSNKHLLSGLTGHISDFSTRNTYTN